VSCQYMSCPYVCHVNASIISLLYIRTHFSYQYICHTCSSHSDIPNTLLLYIRTHLSYQQIYHIRTVLYFQTHLSYLFSTFKHMFHINTPVISVLNIRTSWHLSYQYICHICPLHSNTSFILKHVSCLFSTFKYISHIRINLSCLFSTFEYICDIQKFSSTHWTGLHIRESGAAVSLYTYVFTHVYLLRCICVMTQQRLIHTCILMRVSATVYNVILQIYRDKYRCANTHVCNDSAAPYTHMYPHTCICYGVSEIPT